MHVPVATSHVVPFTQSSLLAHFALHALSPSHSNESGQAMGASQAPLPLQSAIRPPLHPGPQTVFPSGYAQAIADLPSQVPAQPCPSSAQALRFVPCGLPTMVVQLPAVPAASHAWHCPSHAVSQQTPSTQKPEAHSLGAPHVEPRRLFGAHVPLVVQNAVVAQSASVVQVVRQTLSSAQV